MEANIRILPPSSKILKKFAVYESAHQLLVVSHDKYETEFHVFRIIKRPDVEAETAPLEDILVEEYCEFSKEGFQNYL
jgi:hypothetical protein